MKSPHFYSLALLILFSCSKPQREKREIPLVYADEHTGAEYPVPAFPDYDDLSAVRHLTDPFGWSDGSGRSEKFEDWSKRRAEIKAEIEHYEIGKKPTQIDGLTASFSKEDSTLSVIVTVNDSSLTLTSKITLPEGEGPFPLLIGIGRGTGSLPAGVFEGRKIATLGYNFSQVMSHTQTRGNEPINKLFPDQIEMGAYSAWPWGVSRIIDGLEMVADEINIDLKHIGITGCSFAGKMALFSGALDERIALTIAQEPGGGGAAAWRVSETLGNVETLGNTSFAWFKEDMRKFVNSIYKLPYDHHELVAMVAPRAVLILGNPDFEWLADESGYVSSVAAGKVWDAFGISDRFGYSFIADHGHCQLPENQFPEVTAFIDKFLLGDTSTNTLVRKHPFEGVNAEMWFDGWTGESTLPVPDKSNVESVYYEVECSSLGASWTTAKDSEINYVTIQEGLNSSNTVPTEPEGKLQIPFKVSRNSEYFFFAKANCANDLDDSIWIRIDDNDWITANGLVTVGWQWVALSSTELTPGDHTLSIAYREDGAKLDKIGITTYEYGPADLDVQPSVNQCDI